MLRAIFIEEKQIQKKKKIYNREASDHQSIDRRDRSDRLAECPLLRREETRPFRQWCSCLRIPGIFRVDVPSRQPLLSISSSFGRSEREAENWGEIAKEEKRAFLLLSVYRF